MRAMVCMSVMFVFGVGQGVCHLKSIRFKCKMVSLSCIGGREAGAQNQMAFLPPPLFLLKYGRWLYFNKKHRRTIRL